MKSLSAILALFLCCVTAADAQCVGSQPTKTVVKVKATSGCQGSQGGCDGGRGGVFAQRAGVIHWIQERRQRQMVVVTSSPSMQAAPVCPMCQKEFPKAK